jgi:aspartyl protease family protein
MNRLLYRLIPALGICFLIGCDGCSRSARKQRQTKQENSLHSSDSIVKNIPAPPITTHTIIKMRKESGVYQIPVTVDGVELYFIFDTGSTYISISETEADFLYKQGKLSDEDIVGNQQFTDANGDISEGTVIILREVIIGNRVLRNISASVVHNQQAPLLFGQSALEKFGKISIDYNKEEIVFE